MSEDGYNPLRWDCKERGCFNWKQRPKIEVFADCFPGRINFGDVDGIVEISGNALLFEWKGEPKEIPQGQRIMYQRLTSDGVITTLMLAGNARNMEVTNRMLARRGVIGPWEVCDLEMARQYVKRWVAWSQNHPRPIKPQLRSVKSIP